MWNDTLSANPNDITVDSIRVSDILMPPVQASIQSSLLVEKFADVARTDLSSLPTVKIGVINQNMYAINNLNVVQGCKKADPYLKIPVHIIHCQDISDIIVQHVHETVNEEPLNLLAIFDAIGILGQNGIDKSQATKMLWLNDTPYEKMFKLDESNLMSNESIEQLQKITDILKERKILPSLVQIPLYIIIKLNRIELKTHQLVLVEKIGAMLSCMTDSKFAWPTPEQIDTMYLYIKQDIQKENNDDDNYKNNNNTAVKQESKNKKDSTYKTKHTGPDDDEESEHDKSNDDNDNFVFPQYITDHLNPQNILQIRYENFDSAEQLQTFLDDFKHQGKNKFTLLWGVPEIE